MNLILCSPPSSQSLAVMLVSLSFVVALCSVLITAAPIDERDSTGLDSSPVLQYINLISAGVSAAILVNLNLFAQYSAAAYCFSSINGAVGASITCSAEGGSCAEVEAAGSTLLLGFST